MMIQSSITVGKVLVHGVSIDAQTRCAHYGTEQDIVAIRFPCCNAFFSCYRCHEQLTDHAASAWDRASFDTDAVLCGACGNVMTIERYLDSGHACPKCSARFNRGCTKHYHLYFDCSSVT